MHRFTGALLLLPLAAWTLTALFFLLRPGFEQAYAPLQPNRLPLDPAIQLQPDPAWEEARLFRTVLGHHLMIREAGQWRHLNAATLEPFAPPDRIALQALLEDAFLSNPQRFGRLVTAEEGQATTDTGVHISLDWNTLTLSQSGRDTRWIDRVYAIHYLRWTGHRRIDQAWGLLGLMLLLYMTYSGTRMLLGISGGGPSDRNPNRR